MTSQNNLLHHKESNNPNHSGCAAGCSLQHQKDPNCPYLLPQNSVMALHINNTTWHLLFAHASRHTLALTQLHHLSHPATASHNLFAYSSNSTCVVPQGCIPPSLLMYSDIMSMHASGTIPPMIDILHTLAGCKQQLYM
mmetsp:Transcript_16477/g.35617  ORF Transcript_16477/g.35617 Transcript_16477/m.35617 type:complete len:139 (+) Transcript_16477:48-464(+)